MATNTTPRMSRTASLQIEAKSSPMSPAAAERNHLRQSFGAMAASLPGGNEKGVEILKDVITLGGSTLTSLTALWDEMGYTPEEREEESHLMMQAVTSCFANRLCMTTKAKEELLGRIGSEKKNVADLEGELGEENYSLDVPMEQVHACHSESGMSLKQVHGRLVERTLALEVLRMERQNEVMRLEEELGSLARELDGDDANVQTDDGGCAWRGWEGGEGLRVDRLRDLGLRVGEAGREARKRREEAEGLASRIRELWDEMEMLDDEEVDVDECGGELGAEVRRILRAQEVGEAQFSPAAGAAGAVKLPITLDSIQVLKRTLEWLEGERDKRAGVVSSCFDELGRIWDRLKTPSDKRAAYAEKHKGLSVGNLRVLYEEVERLDGVRRAMMNELIIECRGALSDVWDAMQLGDAERRGEAPFAFEDVYTEDVLIEHEEHLERCKARLEAMQPILRMLERREVIKSEEAAVLQAQADPSRLLARGRSNFERLKHEEKVRVMVMKEYPKVTEKLRSSIVEYEADHGLLTIKGSRLLESIDAEDEAKEAAKTARREARKVVGSETAATPGAGDGGHVARPASAKGRIPLGAMNRCKDKGGEVGEAGGAGCSKVPRSDLKKGFDQVAGEGA